MFSIFSYGGALRICDCWLRKKWNYVAVSDVILFSLKLTFCLVFILSHGCSTYTLQPRFGQVEGVAVTLVWGQRLLKNICTFPSIKIFAFAEFYFQNILLQQKGLYVDLKIICDFPLKNIELVKFEHIIVICNFS